MMLHHVIFYSFDYSSQFTKLVPPINNKVFSPKVLILINYDKTQKKKIYKISVAHETIGF